MKNILFAVKADKMSVEDVVRFEEFTMKSLRLGSREYMDAEYSSIDMDKIRHEREIELCFENHRYWDLRRWRTAVNELNGPHTGINYLLDWESYKNGKPRFWLEIKNNIDSNVNTPTFPENNYYMPIGSGTIAKNSNVVENPGY